MGGMIGRIGRGRAGCGQVRVLARSAVVVLLAMVAAGCTTKNEEPKAVSRASYASAPCPPPSLPGVPAMGPKFSCGYLTAPENRAKPDGRQIKIAVARLKAASTEPKPDPVV